MPPNLARRAKQSATSPHSGCQLIRSSTPSKTNLGSGVRPDPSHLTQKGLDLDIIVPFTKGGVTSKWTRNSQTAPSGPDQRMILLKFILNPGLPSEVRVQRQPEAIDEHPGSTLIQYREITAIFKNSPIEGTTAKERTLYSTKPGGTTIQQ